MLKNLQSLVTTKGESSQPAQPSQDVERNPRSNGQDERLNQASKAAKAALESQKQARELTARAAATEDPEERQRLLKEALKKETESRSQGKAASWLQRGSIQGAMGGLGVGTAIGTGLGTVTGAVVGTTTSLATGGLGLAIGAGVGALHGPFFDIWKSRGNKHKDVNPTPEQAEKVQIDEEHAAAMQQVMDEVEREPTPPPDDLEQISANDVPSKESNLAVRHEENHATSGDLKASQDAGAPSSGNAEQARGAQPKPRKRPRKLEVRSDKTRAAKAQRRPGSTGETKTGAGHDDIDQGGAV